jgi:DNA mismatch repair ATPase MutS
LTRIRHPLLGDAVPNSVTLGNPSGMIVTGSNMSGKSTFLRTVGVTTVLAQTIYTCLADTYEAPPYVVKSCIGRADDPASGKSYYLVEVDSVLTLVRDSDSKVPHLFLFDELFRGTNAVERVAAGEAVLRSLLELRADRTKVPHVVLAATHDQDLVGLVENWYAAYHFTDAIGDDELLAFDYQLQPGVASARNAIRLLELRGAPATLIARAMERAAELDRPISPDPVATADTTPAEPERGDQPPGPPSPFDIPHVIV